VGFQSTAPQQQITEIKSNSEKIELLSVELLDQTRSLVEELKTLARSLRLEFGWHYLLDLTWTIRNLGEMQGKKIMDAGAGTGILQWYLAQSGAEVYSVDRQSRAALPMRFRNRFKVSGLRTGDLLPPSQAITKHLSRPLHGPFFRRWAGRFLAVGRDLASYASTPSGSGQVIIYNQDLSDLVDIPDNTLDAAVSISALEHNSPEGLEKVVGEIMRVLKPGGMLLATLTAARDQDWWHTASSGWCYTDSSLRRLFDLSPETSSNYDRYDELFSALENCAELRDNLARFYSQADGKGMPGGIWKPEYQPVGVCKIKPIRLMSRDS
jgi:ubiquinone/menaquinone biosynthesis C-methylase UbiE